MHITVGPGPLLHFGDPVGPPHDPLHPCTILGCRLVGATFTASSKKTAELMAYDAIAAAHRACWEPIGYAPKLAPAQGGAERKTDLDADTFWRCALPTPMLIYRPTCALPSACGPALLVTLLKYWEPENSATRAVQAVVGSTVTGLAAWQMVRAVHCLGLGALVGVGHLAVQAHDHPETFSYSARVLHCPRGCSPRDAHTIPWLLLTPSVADHQAHWILCRPNVIARPEGWRPPADYLDLDEAVLTRRPRGRDVAKHLISSIHAGYAHTRAEIDEAYRLGLWVPAAPPPDDITAYRLMSPAQRRHVGLVCNPIAPPAASMLYNIPEEGIAHVPDAFLPPSPFRRIPALAAHNIEEVEAQCRLWVCEDAATVISSILHLARGEALAIAAAERLNRAREDADAEMHRIADAAAMDYEAAAAALLAQIAAAHAAALAREQLQEEATAAADLIRVAEDAEHAAITVSRMAAYGLLDAARPCSGHVAHNRVVEYPPVVDIANSDDPFPDGRLFFVGPHPPPLPFTDGGPPPHWRYSCTTGDSAQSLDAVIAARYRGLGFTVCSCRHGGAGRCAHYYLYALAGCCGSRAAWRQLAAIVLWVLSIYTGADLVCAIVRIFAPILARWLDAVPIPPVAEWFPRAPEDVALLADIPAPLDLFEPVPAAIPDFARLFEALPFADEPAPALPAGPPPEPDVEPPPAAPTQHTTFVATNGLLALLVVLLWFAGYHWSSLLYCILAVYTQFVLADALLDHTGRHHKAFLIARLLALIPVPQPLALTASRGIGTVLTYATIGIELQGGSIANHIRRLCDVAHYPQVVYTAFTASPCSGSYCVPVKRTHWAKYTEVVDGVAHFGLELRAYTLSKVFEIAPLRAACSVGPLPTSSAVHLRRDRGLLCLRDPLTTGATMECAFLRYAPELRPSTGHRRLYFYIALALSWLSTVLCTTALRHWDGHLFSPCMGEPWAGEVVPPDVWAVLSLLLPAGPMRWSAIFDCAVVYSAVTMCTAFVRGDRRPWAVLSLWGVAAAMVYRACVALILPCLIPAIHYALLAAGYYSGLFTYVCCTFLLGYYAFMDFKRTITRWDRPWVAHSRATMLTWVLQTYGHRDLSSVISKAMKLTTGEFEDFYRHLRQQLIHEEHGDPVAPVHLGDLPITPEGPALYAAITWCLTTHITGEWIGFSNELTPRQAKAILRRATYNAQAPRSCRRPGCDTERGRKWKHGICPSCKAACTARPTGLAADWVAAQPTPTFYPPSFVSIPELEAPAPSDIRVDPEVRLVWDGRPSLFRTNWTLADHKPAGVLVGFGVAQCPPTVTRKCHDATVRAVVCRIARDYPARATPGVWHSIRALAFTMPELLGVVAEAYIQPEDLCEFLASFPAPRRRTLEREAMQWTENGCVIAIRGKHRKFTIFVKREWIPAFARVEVPCGSSSYHALIMPLLSYKPRIIQAPHDVTHLATGRVFRPILQKLKTVWHADAPIFYASTDPDKLDAWLASITEFPVFAATDYKMFDKAHTDDTWDLGEELYRRVLDPSYEHYDVFWEVLKIWRRPAGGSRTPQYPRGFFQRLKYIAKTMMSSGRDDTALMNAIVNALAIAIALTSVDHGVPLLEACDPAMLRVTLARVRIAIVGDDSAIALPFSTLRSQPWSARLIADALAGLGLSAKAQLFTKLESLVFLGCRPYRVAGRWLWGPTLGRRLYKHHCSSDHTRDQLAWLRGIAMYEARYLGFVPVLGAMARRVLELTAHQKATLYMPEAHGINFTGRSVTPSHPDPETYVKLCSAYTPEHSTGMPQGACLPTPSLILSCENLISQVRALPVVLQHDALVCFMLHDDL